MSDGVQRVGILGAGQLARMMVQAAQHLSPQYQIRPVILAEKKTDCAVNISKDVVLNDGLLPTLAKFCEQCDVVTIENEFVDLKWLKSGIGTKPLFPSFSCLEMIQNKLHQKRSLVKNHIACLDFIPVCEKADLEKAHAQFGNHFVVKRALHGYDGKGTFIFDQKRPFQINEFWNEFAAEISNAGEIGYVEPLSDFEKELAVIVARSKTGEIVNYPVIETNQEGGICRWAVAPAQVEPKVAKAAVEIARKVIEAFDGVGVFGVEMFLLRDQSVTVNEIAPRVHNSGHLTMDACRVGQFEMHLRAILGLPLSGEELLWPEAAMVNILGQSPGTQITKVEIPSLKRKLEDQELWLHWYGKVGSSLNRKLGHINAVSSTANSALKKAMESRKQVLI